MNLLSGDIRSRKVAIPIADGVAGERRQRPARRAPPGVRRGRLLIAPSASPVQAENGAELSPEGTWDGLPSVAFDAVFVPGGAASKGHRR